MYLFWRVGRLEEFANSGVPVASAIPALAVENSPSPSALPADNCGSACQEFIKQEIKESIAGESAKLTPKPVSAAAAADKQTTYIPISVSFSTQSTDWKDVPGSEVYIDLENDFTSDAYVSWEANLSIANANGTADARLFDKTHGIAVQASTLSVSTSSISQVKSGRIYLWSGNNQYIVQVKSLNSNMATFSSGRIKVVY